MEIDDGPPDSNVGYFGKVTSHGDFVGQRLAPSFRQPWDDWLQESIQHSRLLMGPDWLTTYLSSPIWRFALAPGVSGKHGWAGLLMPSVDRVGRHFPLTLAVAIAESSALPDYVTQQSSWYDRLEDLALSSLRKDFSLAGFDAALSTIAVPFDVLAATTHNVYGPAHTVIALTTPSGVGPAPHGESLFKTIASAALRGQGLWWTDGSQQVSPCLLVCRGLPAPATFAAMLDGKWPSTVELLSR